MDEGDNQILSTMIAVRNKGCWSGRPAGGRQSTICWSLQAFRPLLGAKLEKAPLPIGTTWSFIVTVIMVAAVPSLEAILLIPRNCSAAYKVRQQRPPQRVCCNLNLSSHQRFDWSFAIFNVMNGRVCLPFFPLLHSLSPSFFPLKFTLSLLSLLPFPSFFSSFFLSLLNSFQ
jgi:hypothetical protein